MPLLRIIVGLAGSGKSKLLSSWQADDPSIAICDEGFLPFEASYLQLPKVQTLLASLRAGLPAAAVEIGYMSAQHRDHLTEFIERELPSVHLEWHFFLLDLSQCKNNLIQRAMEGDSRSVVEHVQMNARLSPQISIPNDAILHHVWRPT